LLEVPEVKRIYSSEAPEAFSLAESLGDNSRIVRACSAAIFAIANESGGFTNPQFAEWARRADKFARPDTIDRVLADFAVGLLKFFQGDFNQRLIFSQGL